MCLSYKAQHLRTWYQRGRRNLQHLRYRCCNYPGLQIFHQFLRFIVIFNKSGVAKVFLKKLFLSLQSTVVIPYRKITYKRISGVMWLPKRRLTSCRLSNNTCPAVSVINEVWHSNKPDNLAPTVTARAGLRSQRYLTSGQRYVNSWQHPGTVNWVKKAKWT